MPQKHFPDDKESGVSTFLKTIVVGVLLVVSFGAGYYTANSGYRVVDSGGSALVKSNAAQIVKEENARLQREVIGMTVQAADEHLKKNGRTMFVAIRNGENQEQRRNKTFTNLAVEVKDSTVIHALGWY